MTGNLVVVDGDGFERARGLMTGVAESVDTLARETGAEPWVPAEAGRTLSGALLPLIAVEAELVVTQLHLAAESARLLGEHLQSAHEWYENADARVREALVEVADDVVAGFILTAVGLVQLAAMQNPVLLVAGGVWWMSGGKDQLGNALADHPELLASPFGNLILRMLVSGADETVLGGAAALTPLLGPAAPAALAALAHARRQTTPQTVAAGLFLTLRDPSRTVAASTTTSTARSGAAAPSTISELADTVPRAEAGAGPQVTISTYVDEAGETVYLVSVDGTRDQGFGADEVNDNLSNLSAYAGIDLDQIAAIRQVLHEAGVDGERVVFAGYSQGALVVQDLVNSGDYRVQSVLLAGSPVHGNDVGDGIPVLQLEHEGDVITAAQGYWQAPQSNVMVVSRDPLDGVPPADAFDQHRYDGYRETAALVDADTDPRVAAQSAQVLAPLQGATLVATTSVTLSRVDAVQRRESAP